ncbi:hypothetical protein [Planococcus versutus]|uniref:Uncharacterized protein n=1 Tax=Planococcus versutus TaxID=1302659 RepID=A0A1B1RZK8_9BACL|nr:hypothetical protein [Planococcus versutus]ANU26383.1 hypothetical protein I858_004960 [Planococcus versutus]
MRSMEEAKRLIIAEKLKHYNERLADMQRDLDFFYEESMDDKESLEIIQDIQDKVRRLQVVKNRESQETVS